MANDWAKERGGEWLYQMQFPAAVDDQAHPKDEPSKPWHSQAGSGKQVPSRCHYLASSPAFTAVN
jgi:hypothetical protein